MIVTEKFMRKPFLVEGVRVTEENMAAVAEWCSGQVDSTIPMGKKYPVNYVKVRVIRPLNERQTRAFKGDWVLYAGTGYKVYSDKAFKDSFVPAQYGGSLESPNFESVSHNEKG